MELLKFDIKFCTDQLSGLLCVTDAMWSVVATVSRKEGRELVRITKSRHTHALGLLKSKPKLMLYIASGHYMYSMGMCGVPDIRASLGCQGWILLLMR